MTPAGTLRMLLVFQSTGRVAYISVMQLNAGSILDVAYIICR